MLLFCCTDASSHNSDNRDVMSVEDVEPTNQPMSSAEKDTGIKAVLLLILHVALNFSSVQYSYTCSFIFPYSLAQ